MSETAKLPASASPTSRIPTRPRWPKRTRSPSCWRTAGWSPAPATRPTAPGAAGDPLVARDAYGSRFLLVAPFSYDGGAPDHWYAWDIDSCWILAVAGAGVFGSAEDALA